MSTVLIVDDEPGIRYIVSMVIKQCHLDSPDIPLNAIAAGNGSEGLDLLSRYRPELVILDNWLPDMNGSEWLERSARIWPSTVILISASAQLEKIARTHPRTVGILSKPFKLDQLRSALQEVLDPHPQARYPKTLGFEH